MPKIASLSGYAVYASLDYDARGEKICKGARKVTIWLVSVIIRGLVVGTKLTETQKVGL